MSDDSQCQLSYHLIELEISRNKNHNYKAITRLRVVMCYISCVALAVSDVQHCILSYTRKDQQSGVRPEIANVGPHPWMGFQLRGGDSPRVLAQELVE